MQVSVNIPILFGEPEYRLRMAKGQDTMKVTSEDFIREISSVISKLNCDYAESRISRSKATLIVLSGESVDTISSGESISGSVRILNKGSWGFVSFNNLRDFERFAKRGLEITETIAGEERSGIVSSQPVRLRYKTPVVKDFTNRSLDEKLELSRHYNDMLRDSKFIQTTRTTYKDVAGQHLYLNSEGSEVIYDKSFCGVSFSSVAKDGNVIQPFGDSVAGYGGFEIAENRDEMAADVVKVALDLLRAEPVGGGTYDVIVDQKLAGVFIHEAFGHLSEADFIYENEQMSELMELGRRFGSEDLNVLDDGSISGLPGFIPCDDEGILPKKTFLIRDGLLTGRLHSRETSFRMNEEPTGNARALSPMSEPLVRMTNTSIENGRYTLDEICDDVSGIYAVDVIGGQTNLEMFTFSAGYGYALEKGKKKRMLRDLVLSGNVFQTLKNILKIGNDKKMYGGLGGCGKGGQAPLPVSFGGPHILIKDVLIGGKQR